MLQEKKFYLTKEGLKKITKEFQELKELKLAKTSGDVPKMLQSEDVNMEYLTFQEDMEALERRIQELDLVLKNYEIIKPPAKGKDDTVYLGSKVYLKDDQGNKVEYKLVGTLEADPFDGKISNESPVGKALLGRKVGEVVAMINASGLNYKILKVFQGEA